MVAKCFFAERRQAVTLKLLLAVVVVAATVLSPIRLSAFPDSIDETLAAAKEKYEKARTEAKYAVLARYREVIAELSEKKQVEAATRTQDEMQIFEKDGILLARESMTVAFRKYGETLKKLSDELTTAYTDASAAHAKAGNLDRADKLRRELVAFSLPTKLVSFLQLRTKAYIMHGDHKGLSKPAPSIGEKMNATFEIVNGLSESGYVSIRSINFPNHYLAHGNKRIILSAVEDSDGFRQNATFKKVTGLAAPSGVSFESVNFPGHFIRARNGELWLDKKEPADRFRLDSTFVVSEPLFKLW